MFKDIFGKVLEFIFPTTCIVCRTGNKNICQKCFSQIELSKKDFLNTLSLYKYRDATINRLLWKLKYHHNGDIAEIFGKKMAEELSSWLNQDKENYRIFLIPMPLNKKDRRMYNHAELLAKEISAHLPNSQAIANLLIKNSQKKQAHTKNKHERIKNVEKTICINSENKLNINFYQTNISQTNLFIIVDDVTTTGTSIVNAKYVLADFLNIPHDHVLAITVAH